MPQEKVSLHYLEELSSARRFIQINNKALLRMQGKFVGELKDKWEKAFAVIEHHKHMMTLMIVNKRKHENINRTNGTTTSISVFREERGPVPEGGSSGIDEGGKGDSNCLQWTSPEDVTPSGDSTGQSEEAGVHDSCGAKLVQPVQEGRSSDSSNNPPAVPFVPSIIGGSWGR